MNDEAAEVAAAASGGAALADDIAKLLAPPPPLVGDMEFGRRVDGRWWWSVVVDTSGEFPMSFGGWERTLRKAMRAACRELRRAS